MEIKSNIALDISNFNKKEFDDLKQFLCDKKKCKSLTNMFEKVDVFMFYIKNGGKVCIYYDANGFNGFTTEDPFYLKNKKYVSFELFKTIMS